MTHPLARPALAGGLAATTLLALAGAPGAQSADAVSALRIGVDSVHAGRRRTPRYVY